MSKQCRLSRLKGVLFFLEFRLLVPLGFTNVQAIILSEIRVKC